MLSYILRRIVSTLPVMAIVALFVFSLLYIAPGDPAVVIAGDQASPEDVERIRQIRERAFEKLRESPDGKALCGFWAA